MIKPLLLLFMILGMCCAFASDKAAPLTSAELKAFEELDGKKPPEGFVNAEKKITYEAQQKEIREENNRLNAERDKLNREIKALNNRIELLKNDIDFFERKNERLENTRNTLINSISENRNSINQFNKAVMNYVSEQLDINSHIVLGVPAFARKEDKIETSASKLLVVNMSHPAKDSFFAVGGEIVTTGIGKAQFVVLHKHDNGSFAVEKAGNEIEVTEADKDANGDFFRKSLLFTDYFAELNKDDLWGLVIDAGIGLTYDKFETGSSYVVDYNNEETIKCSEDKVQGKTAFSFCLFVQAIDK